MLHAVLLLGRLEGEAELRRLGQAVFDAFCRDMDASLREMGVGDLAVPRRMRGIGEAFYGRQTVYRKALTVPDQGPRPLPAMYLPARPGRMARIGWPPMSARRCANWPPRTGRRSAGRRFAFPTPARSRSRARPAWMPANEQA